MQVSKRSQGSPHQSCSQPLSCIPAHSGVFCVCSRQTKAVNLALTALKRSTRWWRIYNIMYTPGVLHECYSAMPEHGSEEKTACKAATQCCKGVSGSLAVSTALWHVWAKHSSLPLSLTQRWVKDLQCCVQMGHNTVWWQHQHRVRAQEGWLMQARVAEWGMRKQNLESSEHIRLLCSQFSFALRRQLFFPNHRQHRAYFLTIWSSPVR